MRLFACLLLFSVSSVFAQVDGVHMDETEPDLIGGLAALQDRIVYPEAEQVNGIEGRVIVQMVVDTVGVPRDVVVLRGVSAGLDSASVRVVREARFAPGTQQGRPVRVRFTLPVTFRLSEQARTPFSADTLLARLGAQWTTRGLPPAGRIEANAPRSGATRYVWADPDAETERVEATVVRDTVHAVTLVFAPGASALFDMRRLSNTIGALNIEPDSAGYYTAYDLAVNGFESRTDVAVDLPARTWRLRAAGCSGTGCIGTYPVLIGGLRGLQAGIRYPRRAQLAGTEGSIQVAFTVTTSGTTRGAAPVGDGLRGIGSDDLTQAAITAVRAARFIPARDASGAPIEARMALPVNFRIR